jgi:hypothetical protein
MPFSFDFVSPTEDNVVLGSDFSCLHLSQLLELYSGFLSA